VTFSVYPLRLHFAPGRPIQIPEGLIANFVRGQFGKILMRDHPDAYRRYFAPEQISGPSGFRDPPRPFVLRIADPAVIGVNLFEMHDPPIDLFKNVLTRVAFESLGAASLQRAEGTERLDISLRPAAGDITRVRVQFKTPTELKGVTDPEFAPLFSRIRDRVSLLKSLYGDGPLEIDFRSMGDRARVIRMTRCELHHESAERYSLTQKASHPLGGFTGIAEYEGDLTEFLPYLQAAKWTGVGRQTVWGKGEIHSTPL
jgi:hypothetical protein